MALRPRLSPEAPRRHLLGSDASLYLLHLLRPGAGRLRLLSGRRDRAELLQESEDVVVPVELLDLAVGNAIERDPTHRHSLARGRYSTKVTSVGAMEHPSLGHAVALSYEALDHDVEVGEALAVGEPDPVGPLLTGLLASHLWVGLLVVHAVWGEKLIEHGAGAFCELLAEVDNFDVNRLASGPNSPPK